MQLQLALNSNTDTSLLAGTVNKPRPLSVPHLGTPAGIPSAGYLHLHLQDL